MKPSLPHLQFHLAEDIEANLTELRHKYAQQLRKPLAHAVHKLNRQLARLLNKHTLARHHKAARKVARYLVASLGDSFHQPPAARFAHSTKRKPRPLA